MPAKKFSQILANSMHNYFSLRHNGLREFSPIILANVCENFSPRAARDFQVILHKNKGREVRGDNRPLARI